MRSPVSAIVIHDFTGERGVEVPERIVRGITSSCVQSLGNDARIKQVPVTRETSNRLPEGAIDVRGQFKSYDVGISFSGPLSATVVDLQMQICVHDLASGKLLASKVVKKHYFWDKPEFVDGRFRSVFLDDNETDTKLFTTIANQVKDVVLKYLTTAGRKPAE